jgi:hypothetical protein
MTTEEMLKKVAGVSSKQEAVWWEVAEKAMEAFATQEVEAAIAERMPTITDEEIKAHFTTTHKSWKEEPYHKINYDRVTGAKWMRDWFRSRMEEKNTNEEKPEVHDGWRDLTDEERRMLEID